MSQTELKKPITYWQYKDSPALKTLLDGFYSLIRKYYPSPIWTLLDLDTASGYALDLIGQRLGYPRPKEIPESVGTYDISRYAQAYYDQRLEDLALVKDDTYRYMLKLRVMMWQPWHTISINSMCRALEYAFPGVQFILEPRPGQKIMDLYILSFTTYPQKRALLSDAIRAPIGQTLLIHDIYGELTYITVDEAGTLLEDGVGNNIITGF